LLDSPSPEPENDNVSAVQFTERMLPESAHARTFWEHVARYRFAKDFAKDQRILDIACGEGYGSAALKRAGAASVVGVDISSDACELARTKYGIDARVGDALAIPLPSQTIDLVVSFETIEHVESPARFIAECARVLTPQGTLIVSTPNRPVYSSEGHQNPFHHLELNEDEFLGMLNERFQAVRLYTQFPRSAAWWSPRSFASEESPWLKIKGFWRFSTWLCPAIRPTLDRSMRAKVSDLILAEDRFPASLFNPYIVRSRARGNHEKPYILVAIAQGVKNI
jgi:SAM-dependent methyltransferase